MISSAGNIPPGKILTGGKKRKTMRRHKKSRMTRKKNLNKKVSK